MKKYIRSDSNDPSNLDQYLGSGKYDLSSSHRRGELAHSDTTPPEVLAMLVYDPDPSVRMSLGWNPGTPAEALADLAHTDGNTWEIRNAVAHNPNASEELLTELARDRSAKVRQAAACNPNTPVEVLLQLLRDKDWLTRVHASGNPALENNLTPEILAKLAKSQDTVVRGIVASNEQTPPDILAKLASDPDSQYRVAYNSSTPEDVLWDLYATDNWRVLIQLARNPSAPAELLAALANHPAVSGDDDHFLFRWLMENPNTPESTKQAIRRKLRDLQDF